MRRAAAITRRQDRRHVARDAPRVSPAVPGAGGLVAQDRARFVVSRFGTPIGPLWVDAAWPIANRGTNSGVRFSFGIGRTF